MIRLNENNIEDFIRKNRDKFVEYFPPVSHKEKFLFRLNYGIKHIISIVPYLIRVTVFTIIIFTASILIWNNCIRKDRMEMTLRDKISLVVGKIPSNQSK